MSAAGTVALFASPHCDAAAEEMLRILAGLVACAEEPRLLTLGPGHGGLDPEKELPPDAERYLEGLAAFDVRPAALEAAELRHVLAGCERLLRLAPPDRSGEPALLVLDDATLAAYEGREEALVDALLSAGQVVRITR